MTYVDGFVIAVPAANKEAYLESARKVAPIFRDHGALRHVECWGDHIPDGKTTDFKMAVKAKEDEVVVFSWIVWPSKEVRDAASQKVMQDPRMKDVTMPFDGKRMIFGGFQTIFDEGA